MSKSNSPLPRKRLPTKPSEEHLKKQAKRRIKLAPGLQLAEAQHQLAQDYGCRNWSELMHMVETMNRGAAHLVSVKYEMEALPAAANASDLAKVREILESGSFTQHDLDLALARSVLRFKERGEIARLLIEHGADPDGQYGSNYGPIVFVTGEALDPDGLQFLIDAGADVTFAPIQTKYGRQCPLSCFLGSYVRGRNEAKHRGIQILLRCGALMPTEITPAMLTIHTGDAMALGNILDQDPALLNRRFAEMPYGNLSLRGATLLHCAVEFGETQCCAELFKRGAEIDMKADVIDGSGGQTPLFHAILNANLDLARMLIDRKANVNAGDAKGNTPLWIACTGWAPEAECIAVAKLLIEHGAAVRHACEEHSTALHQAAKHGPLAMVVLLLLNGAKEWQADKHRKLPIDYARAGVAADKEKIIELLDRPVIYDPVFKAAVHAIHAGDLETLRSILRGHPNLVLAAAVEPDCYPPSYFKNPRLLWFVANNPTLMETMPANIVQIAKAIIDTGPSVEDLNYTLELVMTSSPARDQGHQVPLMKLLLDHGAKPADLLSVLAHRELASARFLLDYGIPLTAPMAAAFGNTAELPAVLIRADARTRQAAFAIAVINEQVSAARLCLQAGADVDAFLPVHAHSLPVHQAAVNNDVEMLKLLIEYDAQLDIRDTLWNATPLGWAIHTNKPAAEQYLRSITDPSI